MGFWSGLKAIFRAPETAQDAVKAGIRITDGIIDGVDKVIYTAEEKADAKQKTHELILELWKQISTENSQQSIARRELAKMVFKVYLCMFLMAVAVYPFNLAYAKFIFSLVGELFWLVSAIGVIYFGPHQLQKLNKG